MLTQRRSIQVRLGVEKDPGTGRTCVRSDLLHESVKRPCLTAGQPCVICQMHRVVLLLCTALSCLEEPLDSRPTRYQAVHPTTCRHIQRVSEVPGI